MLVSTIDGEAWEKHVKAKAEAEKKQQEADKKEASAASHLRGRAPASRRFGSA